MPNPITPGCEPQLLYLEHYPDHGDGAERIPLIPLPFQIGRSRRANYTVPSRQVSKEHAEIFCCGDDVRIRDLGSTNGTFVNGQRITETSLMNGDIIHFGHKEFRFGQESLGGAGPGIDTATEPVTAQLPSSRIMDNEHLRELLMGHRVHVLFQPIVHLRTRQVLGYEALGRGNHSQLTSSPAELLRLADRCRLAQELSQLFRNVAIEEASRMDENLLFFLNLHPSEIGDKSLMDSLGNMPATLRAGQQLVLEVHEEAALDSAMMQGMREQLDVFGMGLAYDDFGSGQARLMELIEVPPDFVKFHMNLIRGLDRDSTRQELVHALTRVTTHVGVPVIAEGIETEAEAAVCLDLGCQYGQGFLFGHPQSVTD